MKFISDKKTGIFYSVIAIILLLGFYVIYKNNKKLKLANDLVLHTQEIIHTSDELLFNLLSLESNAGSFIVTENQHFFTMYNSSRSLLLFHLKSLKELTKDNPTQKANINSLSNAVNDRLSQSNKFLLIAGENKYSQAEKISMLEQNNIISDSIKNLIGRIKNVEFNLLKDRKSTTEKTSQNSNLLLMLLCFFLLIVFLLVILIINNQKKSNLKLEAITQSQKLLSQYSLSLIEASRDPMFTISPLGKITDINEASVRMIGQSRKEIIGSDFINYFTEPEKASYGYKEIFNNGFVNDYPLILIDGTLRNVLFNGSIYKDGMGKIIGAVVVARDVTEQKKSELELIKSKEQAECASAHAERARIHAESATQLAQDATLIAENAVKAKQQFLSNMSHEIRTPMNAIIGFTKVVLKTELSAKQLEYMNAIKLSGDALIVLINDVLDLAKVDSGNMSFEKIPFNLELSISAMLHLFEPKIEEKNLVLKKEFDTKIPEVLVGDPVRLHQIILNLMSNAIKFTTNGSISSIVQLKEEDEENALVEFKITDTGIGIDIDEINKIFENFQQASSKTSRLYGGTGLGLAIVKQLVESQGGKIEVNSNIGQGSTFCFTLPFKKTKIKLNTEAELVELHTEIKNIRVLVVEDIALNQLLMKTLLDDFGFDRDIASNGRIAIEKLLVNKYDIILMDLQMPEMNGYEATEYIRKTMLSTIPIIALTADVTTVDLAKCRSVGMDDYLAKPVDERLLFNKILNLVSPSGFNENLALSKTIIEKRLVPNVTNLDYLRNRPHSNNEFIKEMISLYLLETPSLIQLIEESLAKKNWVLLQSTIHKIVPSFFIMGIDKHFENIAREIQSHAKDVEKQKEIPELVSKIAELCKKACNELEIEYNKL